MIQAIVCGTGPSFYQWVNKALIRPDITIFSCGVASRYVRSHYYCICDASHIINIPKGATIIRQRIDLECNNLLFPEHYEHAGSCGGMSISMACHYFDYIALVGFDGKMVHETDEENLRHLLITWQSRNKKLYSLMPESTFNDILLKVPENDKGVGAI